jgi:hypothetical protein
MKTRNLAAILAALSLSAICGTPSWADQWTGNLNVTSTHIEDDSNVATLYVTTTQATVNPAGCSATDGYEGNDPVIVQEMLAITLTAISLGSTVQIYVSSSKCVNYRPDIENLQMSAP